MSDMQDPGLTFETDAEYDWYRRANLPPRLPDNAVAIGGMIFEGLRAPHWWYDLDIRELIAIARANFIASPLSPWWLVAWEVVAYKTRRAADRARIEDLFRR